MKFLLSFTGVLVVILLVLRYFPSAPINPVLPVGPQHEVNGHGADVPTGPSAEATHEGEGAKVDCEINEPEAGAVSAVKPGQAYGTAVSTEGAIPMSALATVLGTKDSARVKLIGKASGVCQAKGCWMTLPTADGKEMRVRFKDYGFFVPKELLGHEVVVSGWAHREVVPVANLKHYAKDAGKSAKEIAAITQDEQQLNFEADGVRVLN